MHIKCSVVIPTFKRPHLLKQCLCSLLQQQINVRYEVIVVSDGKDKDTEALMNEFSDSQIPFIYASLDKKCGPAAARNKGWQIAKGELIAFTDDDTQPSMQWLHQYWEAYIEQRTNRVAFTGVVKVPLPQYPTDYERNTAGLETADFVTANCACTKEVLHYINGFDEDFTMAWREDSEFQFRLLKAGIPIIKVSAAIVVHPVRKAMWGVSLNEQKKSMFNALLYKKHPHLFRKKILSSPLWNYYGIILSFVAAVILLATSFYLTALVTASIWLFLLSKFVMKRLQTTSLSLSHVSEMIVTSLLIPFLSVFWTLYGAYKFKVFFL